MQVAQMIMTNEYLLWRLIPSSKALYQVWASSLIVDRRFFICFHYRFEPLKNVASVEKLRRNFDRQPSTWCQTQC